jgi:hypothetical protein
MYMPANAVLQAKVDETNANTTHCVVAGPGAPKNTLVSKRIFQIQFRNKKTNELVPHIRGTCSWK